MGEFSYIGGEMAAIRCYRSAAKTTGGDGVYIVLPWDAESATPSKIGFTHSTSVNPEEMTCNVAGRYLLTGAIKIGSGTWDELRAKIEINGTPIATPNIGASAGVLGLTTGPNTLPICCVLQLVAGDVVRIEMASIGEASVALDVGETDTWIELSQF